VCQMLDGTYKVTNICGEVIDAKWCWLLNNGTWDCYMHLAKNPGVAEELVTGTGHGHPGRTREELRAQAVYPAIPPAMSFAVNGASKIPFRKCP
jgi:hypothetical protein